MALRSADWLRQAEADLALGKHARHHGHYEWACFAAQQAAEKAAKAVHPAADQTEARHSVAELLGEVSAAGASISPELLDRARELDRHYYAARYPNHLPEGAPADDYGKFDATQALDDAQAILEFCRNVLTR